MIAFVPISLNDTPNSQQVSTVIALADRNRRWLGFLPASALRQMAAARRVLVTTSEDQVLGYVLFDLTRSDIRLVHVCVDDAARGSGLARRMIDELSTRHLGYSGIRLTCRDDYEASKVWPKLGFRPVREKPGRGKDRKRLTVWWKEHPARPCSRSNQNPS